MHPDPLSRRHLHSRSPVDPRPALLPAHHAADGTIEALNGAEIMTKQPTVVLLHGAGAGPWVWERVVSRYQAEMPGLFVAPAGPEPTLSRCAYVKLQKDRSVLPSQQIQMIDRLENPRVHAIDAGHMVMLSEPSALTEILLQEAMVADD